MFSFSFLFFCFFVFSFLFPFRYAHKHDKSYADTPESIRADGYVYEISFQETLQELAVRVGKALNKTVPDQIEQELNMKLAEKRDGKYSKRRERASRNGSTVVDISIHPPSFKPVSWFLSRSPLF